MRVAFYPVLKAPNHPVPSGDREMARLLLAALHRAGHEAEIASHFRSFSKTPDPQRLVLLEAAAQAETTRLLAYWNGAGRHERPEIWLTYHLYYKAPDLIGPAIAADLDIPYVVAEASHAQKRNRDAWQAWQAHVEQALQAATVVLCFTPVDRDGLQRLPKLAAQLLDLPPFIDVGPQSEPSSRLEPSDRHGPVRLVTLAMMRGGVKLQSYRFLASALQALDDLDWHLAIIGDGPSRADVEAAFAGFAPGRIVWAGQVAHADVARHLARADLFLWPGFGEAYGLVYLEAQAMGLPVIALNCGGVASTMRPGQTGLLVDVHEPQAYGAAVRSLVGDAAARLAMGQAARRFVQDERNLDRAAGILSRAMMQAAKAR